ncbi:MAG: hypothetical protein QW521_05260 [Desulfurococcaceae archaeon]
MYEVTSVDEVERALRSYRVVMVEYYNPKLKESIEFTEALKIVEKTLDPSILIMRVSAINHPELLGDVKAIPCLKVFLDGKLVLEQMGGFGKRDFDAMILRRTIRDILKNHNVFLKI